MCGIWGVFPTVKGPLFKPEITAMEQAMILTSLRGQHSTGIAAISDPQNKPKVLKTLGGPSYILNSDAWTKIQEFLLKKAQCAFGHGRFATKGEINIKNAHPFTVGHITLVHNGTISWGLEDEHKEAETEVDSHALAAAIAKKGMVKALDDVVGAYAVIVHDAKEKCVYVVRNDDRPLHRLVTNTCHIVMSEFEALQYLAKKNNIYNPKIEYYPKHVIFKYDIENRCWTDSNELKDIESKKYLPTPYNPPIGNSKWRSGGSHTSGVGSTNKEITSYQKLELMCVKKEKCDENNPKNKQWRYIFYDVIGQRFTAISSKDDDREGRHCSVWKHVRLTDNKGEVNRIIPYKEIEWDGDPKTQTASANDEEVTPNVITRNNNVLTREQWKQLVKTQDCSICSDCILAGEAEDTIVMGTGVAGDTIICRECIRQGKHHAYGFGQ